MLETCKKNIELKTCAFSNKMCVGGSGIRCMIVKSWKSVFSLKWPHHLWVSSLHLHPQNDEWQSLIQKFGGLKCSEKKNWIGKYHEKFGSSTRRAVSSYVG